MATASFLDYPAAVLHRLALTKQAVQELSNQIRLDRLPALALSLMHCQRQPSKAHAAMSGSEQPLPRRALWAECLTYTAVEEVWKRQQTQSVPRGCSVNDDAAEVGVLGAFGKLNDFCNRDGLVSPRRKIVQKLACSRTHLALRTTLLTTLKT